MSEKIKTAVMEVIKAHMNGEDKNTKAVLSDVMESVNELETLEQESTYYPPCQDCNKKMDEIRRIYDKIKEQEPCDDAISREAVLDTTICEGISCDECSFNEIDGESGCLLHARIDELPSVTPSRRKGHWIETEYHRWKCSICREKGMSEWDNIHDVRTNFCPNCGTKMESEVNE